MLYKEGKDYKFSFKKLQEDYMQKKLPVGQMWKVYDGARVIISKDRVQGLIHGYETKPGQVINLNGMQVQMGGATKEEVCLLVDILWCTEV